MVRSENEDQIFCSLHVEDLYRPNGQVPAWDPILRKFNISCDVNKNTINPRIQEPSSFVVLLFVGLSLISWKNTATASKSQIINPSPYHTIPAAIAHRIIRPHPTALMKKISFLLSWVREVRSAQISTISEKIRTKPISV